MGSDHEVFEAAGFRVPMVYFHDYPDVTIHTQKDQPENLDATKLGRVAYMGAGHRPGRSPRCPKPRPTRLLAVTRADVESRIALAKAARGPGRRPRAARGDRLRASRRSIPSRASGRRPRKTVAADTAAPAQGLPPPAAARGPARPDAQSRDRRPAERLLLRLLRRHPGRRPVARPRSPSREDGDVLAYEALNLADGKRSVSEIRDILDRPLRPGPASGGRRVLRAPGEGRRRRLPVKIAQIASIRFSVPPRSHGGTEIAIDLLTRGLVARGHEVTLFASGDSQTTARAPRRRARARPRTIRTSTSYLEREYEVRNAAEAYARRTRFDVLHSHWPTPAAYFSDRDAPPERHDLRVHREAAPRLLPRALSANLQGVCITEAQNRMLGGGLPGHPLRRRRRARSLRRRRPATS